MQELETSLKELRESVRQGVRDHSLITAIRKQIGQIRLEEKIVQPYCEGLFRLYDLSNSSFFIVRPPNPKRNEQIQLDPLAINIKAVVLKMLATLVAFFNDHPTVDLPHSLLYEALQIMVMVSRVLLDLNQSAEVGSIYGLVVTFRQAVGPVLSPQSQLAHCLNIVELSQLDVDSRKIDLLQFRKAMQSIQSLAKSSENLSGFVQFARQLALQVILKLLKKGDSADAKSLIFLLPEKMQLMVSELINVDFKLISDGQSFTLSPFYELYLQIKNYGVENIAEENLRMLLKKEQNFNDARLFDVVALTGEILPLEIWFEINLNSRAKNEQIQAAYRCFMYMIDVGLQQVDSRGQSLCQLWKQKINVLGPLVKLARVVMVSLIAQKKDNMEPILNIVKRLSKLLINAVIGLFPNCQQIQQYTDKLLLLCGKYGLSDIARSVSCVEFYYELIMGIAGEESFSRFYKTNLMDKGSELFRTLKLAYEFRIGKEIPAEQQKELLKKQPFILILFAKEPLGQLIVRLPPSEFAKLKEKWQAYLLLIQDQDGLKQSVLSKLLIHLEETLIYSEWREISQLDLSYMEHLKGILLNMIKEGSQTLGSNLKCQICIVLLYFSAIVVIPDKLVLLNGAILLNRYSKLLKLLSMVFDEFSRLPSQDKANFSSLFLYLSKTLLCAQLQLLKIQYLQGKVQIETGLLVLIDLLHEFIQKGDTSSQSNQFFKFVRFDILCLCDAVVQSELTYQKNVKLLKLYCSSRYIKKQLKLKIMRRLIREDLLSDSKLLSLSDLIELIQIAEDTKEKHIFASYILRAFGQEGKTCLMLMSAKEPQTFQFLFQGEGVDEQ